MLCRYMPDLPQMFYVTGGECRLSKRIYITDCNGREGCDMCDMMELKVVDDPANAVVDEEAETPKGSKGPQAMLDTRGSLVDDMHQVL